jgi:hypothetical protein
LDRLAFDAGNRDEQDAEREIHHRLLEVGLRILVLLMGTKRGGQRGRTRKAKETGGDAQELDLGPVTG